jgi:flagellar basal body rod protein FlgG
MNVSLYQAAAGMKATARWQETISENLSSSFIPGFKRQNISFSAVESGLMGPSSTTINGGSRHFSLPSSSVSTDFQPGELKPTGGATDLAIEGRGFFEVQMPNGVKAYTRDGEFRANAQGQLVTKQGYRVQGAGGPIQLDAKNASPVTVSANGEVSQGGNLRGTVKVVDFNDYSQLQSASSGYFLAGQPGLSPTTVTKANLHQGYLESANTTTVSEMANLLCSVRLFEANQKVIQNQDERMGRMIADLGNPS